MFCYVLDFITLVVHGHGQDMRLGTCLVRQQCVSCAVVVPLPCGAVARPGPKQGDNGNPKEKMVQYTPITKYTCYIVAVGPFKQHQ